MSQENQSSLRFSLEESLWFRKGQEVEELVSISLDPDITIQENDQYVTIRGSLELTGEYNSYQESNPNEDENLTNQKYVQTVEERDEGICEFSHRFPVDITIPNNRIQSIYDIDVVVESFDYTLPERSCLKLSAELTISGLYGAQQNEVQEEEQNLDVLYRSTAEQNENIAAENPYLDAEQGEEESELFTAEARKEPDEESVVAPNQFPHFSYQDPNDENTNQEFSFYGERNESTQYTEITVENQTVSEEHIEEQFYDESSSSSSSLESPPKKDFKKKIIEKLTKKKTMSLTEFFARKEEGGEDQAKLKVCIVQKGDTLDRLADRYDVSMQKLLQVNQLDLNQEIHEGLVLYIPEAMAKK